MLYAFPYGSRQITLNINGSHSDSVHTISYESKPAHPSARMIEQALNEPIAAPLLQEAAQGAKNAVILISDGSRLSPSSHFLEHLIERLQQAGIADHHIKIIIALGAHRPHTEAEIIELVGSSIYRLIAVANHSPLSSDCVCLGQTNNGTPIEINKDVVQADFVLVTGNVEPHGLTGFSGGMKAIFPGTASRRSIEHNHALSHQHRASPGNVNHPIRLDFEEMMQWLPRKPYLFNVVTDHQRHIMYAAAGHIIEAHRVAAEQAAAAFLVPVSRKYNIVIASAGGRPKDKQFYQVVKALLNASSITEDGGHIVLIAQCDELLGNGMFQHWLETVHSREERLQRLQQQFVLGPHKFEHLESVLQTKTVWLYSDIPAALVELLGMRPIQAVQPTIDSLLKDDPSVAVMPFGALTFPQLNR